jgi:hypothetical protein
MIFTSLKVGSMDKILIGIMGFYYFYILAYMYYMFTCRRQAVANKEVRARHFKAYQGDTTENLQIIQNHFNNQFQVPILFFIVCVLCLQQQNVTQFTIIIASLFVITRMIHSVIHLGQNNPLKRALVYFLGVVLVGVMLFTNLL